jgi:replicative superfamily II helicase
MNSCEQLKITFTNELTAMIDVWKQNCIRLSAEGSEDDAILEKIKLNVGDIFGKMFTKVWKDMCKDGAGNIEIDKLTRNYFELLDRITAPWAEKMEKDKAHNLMEKYYIEQIKLETAQQIRDMFLHCADNCTQEG